MHALNSPTILKTNMKKSIALFSRLFQSPTYQTSNNFICFSRLPYLPLKLPQLLLTTVPTLLLALLLTTLSSSHAASAKAETEKDPPPTPQQRQFISSQAKALTGRQCRSGHIYKAISVPGFLADSLVRMLYDKLRKMTMDEGGKLVRQKRLNNPLGFELQLANSKGGQAYMAVFKKNDKYLSLGCEL